MTKSLRIMSMAALALAAAAPAAQAEVLTPQEALSRLGAMADAPARLRSAVAAAPVALRPVVTAEAPGSDLPAAYAFNFDGGGYAVVPADDAVASPLLGYSASGAIDAQAVPCGLAYMLESYSRQVEWLRAQGTPSQAPMAAAATVADRAPIEPLCHTTWDQNNPYFLKTPVCMNDGMGGVIHCYTGCQATSMAQVMKYFNHPAKGTGEIAYQSVFGSYRYDVSFNFGETEFDWANMLDSYAGSYTEEQADAVATLMAAAGASVQMLYSMYTSAAYSSYVPESMYTYLGYSRGAECVMRDYYWPTEGWDDLVYANLSQYGPVLYSGISASGSGHAFVCDGYSADGYFHFNWGWSGASDGYFLLSALAPGQQGSGGSSGAAYNYDQDIIAGLTPAAEGDQAVTPRPCITGYEVTDGQGNTRPGYSNDLALECSDPAWAAGSTIAVKGTMANFTQTAKTISLALQFTSADGLQQKVAVITQQIPQAETDEGSAEYNLEANTITIANMMYAPFEGTATMPALSEGKWRLNAAMRLPDTGEWQWVRWPISSTGIYWMRVDADGNITIDTVETELAIENFLWADDHSPADNRYQVSYTFDIAAPVESWEGTVYGVLYRSGYTKEMSSTSTPVDIQAGGSVHVAQSMFNNTIVKNKDYYVMLYADALHTNVIGGPYTFTAGNGPDNALDTIEATGNGGATRVFTLQGVELAPDAKAAPGLVIELKDGKAAVKKVVR